MPSASSPGSPPAWPMSRSGTTPAASTPIICSVPSGSAAHSVSKCSRRDGGNLPWSIAALITVSRCWRRCSARASSPACADAWTAAHWAASTRTTPASACAAAATCSACSSARVVASSAACCRCWSAARISSPVSSASSALPSCLRSAARASSVTVICTASSSVASGAVVGIMFGWLVAAATRPARDSSAERQFAANRDAACFWATSLYST